jgi:hypothetical protein
LAAPQYVGITDKEALDAFHYLCRTEGIIPALESSHAFAYAMKLAKDHAPRPVHPGQPLGPGRQGHRHRGRPLGRGFLRPPQLRGSPSKAASKPCQMSRIEALFAQLQAKGRKALIPYVTAGFPFADITPALMHGMVEAGADVIELGVPFSDPMADGPVIQKAGEKALAWAWAWCRCWTMCASSASATTPPPWC